MIKLDFINGNIELDGEKYVNYCLNRMLQDNNNFFTLFFRDEYKTATAFNKDMSVRKVKIIAGDEYIILTLNISKFYNNKDTKKRLIDFCDFDFSNIKALSLHQIKIRRIKNKFIDNILKIISNLIEKNF